MLLPEKVTVENIACIVRYKVEILISENRVTPSNLDNCLGYLEKGLLPLHQTEPHQQGEAMYAHPFHGPCQVPNK
jgi:hypothetical protein